MAKQSSFRILAGFLALVMIMSLLPASVFAVGMDSYTVRLTDGTDVLALDGVAVTLTNKADETLTSTQQTAAGVATFQGFVEEEATYTLSVASVEGYEAVASSELTVALGEVSHDVVLTEKEPEPTEITGIEVTPYVGKYDGKSHEAVTVTGKEDGDVLTYSVDGSETFADKVPTIEEPDTTVKVIVKVVRAGHIDFVSEEVTASVSKGEIAGIILTPYADKVYDGEAHEAVTVEGALETDTITYSTDGETYSKEVPTITTPGNLTVYVKIVREKYEEYNESVDASIVKAEIEGIVVTPYSGTYDKEEHPAITITGNQEGDIITYSTDGGQTYSEEVPTIQNAGSMEIHVKVQREHHNDLPTPPAELKVTATVAKAKISGVTAEGYTGVFDGTEHDAMTVTGTQETDNRQYKKGDNGSWEKEMPKVWGTKDSGTYYVKISRSANYDDLVLKVEVSITKYQNQQLSFAGVSDVVYSDKNTFQYTAATNEEDAEGKITYRIIGGTAEATIDRNTGVVTYTSVGTVKVEATIAECDNYKGTKKEYEVTISYTAVPEFTVTEAGYTDNDGVKWHNTDVVIAAPEGWTVVEGTNAVDADGWAENITKSEEETYHFQVAFKNTDGQITDLVAIDTFAIDKNAPRVADVDIHETNADPSSKVLNFLTFGMYFKESVVIEVTTEDLPENNACGVQEVIVHVGDDQRICRYDRIEDKYTTTVAKEDLNGSVEIRVEVKDNLGNTTGALKPSKIDADEKIKNDTLMIEKVAPTLNFVYKKGAEEKNALTGDQNDWYDGPVEFNITAADADSGLREVKITINGAVVESEIFYDNTEKQESVEEKVSSKAYTVSTDNEYVARKEDGSYTIVAEVTDNAGNVCEDTRIVYVDMDAPYITGFDFQHGEEDKGAVEGNESVEYNENGAQVVPTDYGFYFAQNTEVIISAQDVAPSAGIKSITAYLKDVEGNYYIAKKDDAGEIIFVKSDTIRSDEDLANAEAHLVNDKNQITVIVPANFKGQIYAKATDNVNNTTEFVHPSGVIVEDGDKHDEETHIAFAKDEAQHTTNDGGELYTKDVKVTITVTDTYSGIRSIEWYVKTPHSEEKSQEGSITVPNNGDVTGTGWTILAAGEEDTGTDINLVTRLTRDIEVTDNSNDIVVYVTMTDRAGNVTQDDITFSIDKTAPVVKVDMNTDDDPDHNGFFDANRSATFTVYERNFTNSGVGFAVTLTNDNNKTTDVVVTPDFKVEEENGQPKEYKNEDGHVYYKYTMEYVFSDEGDYTFGMSASDLAQWQDDGVDYNDPTTCTAFTIDKTAPVVSVSYDNNDALNGNYYKADRVATITVKEHNFDKDRAVISIVATDDGEKIEFSEKVTWRSSGNTHTATITYDADAKYTFDIAVKDKAGNDSKDYNADVFYVDKTAPSLEISGVADKSANNGDIIPVITYSDTNFDKDEVTISLSGVNNGVVNYAGSYEEIHNGQTYTYANFEKVQGVDDIYTLTVKLTDKAGNMTEKTIMFSANRFGSVYDLSEVADIIGKYLQTEQDIVIREVNVDSLDREGIVVKLTKNGTPTDLVEGTDYTVEVSGGNGQWSIYTYTISKDLFAGDGRYSVAIYSEDAAGNVNENIDESKEAEISFGIDKTVPVIVPIDLESGKQYPVELKTVSVEIKDNLVLEGVKIYLDGQEIQYTLVGETYTFEIPETNSTRDVTIVAVDAAGNEYPVEITDILVSTNLFVRWYNNTPLFIGSIAGVVIIILAIVAFIVFGKKKKNEGK